MEEIVSRHGVPSEILSDRGKAFLSELMTEVQGLLGAHRVNTTAYHPQTDGLVERYNRTLTTMLAKTAERGGRDWDQHLPYVYRASEQESTKESPFFLLYGRDPRLPVEAVLSPPQVRRQLDLKDYGSELVGRLGGAWDCARACIKKAQKRQKKAYDRKVRCPDFAMGERVFLLKPAEKTGKARKLARAFHGPYRVTELLPNNAYIRRVDRPQEEPILMSLQRLRRCPEEIGDEFWPPSKPRKRKGQKPPDPPQDSEDLDEILDASTEKSEESPGETPDATPMEKSKESPAAKTQPIKKWSGRLRSHPRTDEAQRGGGGGGGGGGDVTLWTNHELIII